MSASLRKTPLGAAPRDPVGDVPRDEEELADLYAWIDSIPLSRPKRNVARDFADAVLAAEIVHHYHPRLVELHNYVPANSRAYKVANWGTFNAKVLRKLRLKLTKSQIDSVAGALPGAAEDVLMTIRARLEGGDGDHHGGAREAPSTPVDGWSIAAGSVGGGGGEAAPGPTPPSVSFLGRRTGSGREGGGEQLYGLPWDLAGVMGTREGNGDELGDNGAPEDGDAFRDECAIGTPGSRCALRADGGRDAAGIPGPVRAPSTADPHEEVALLEIKVQKLESLLRIKDAKIRALEDTLRVANGEDGRREAKSSP